MPQASGPAPPPAPRCGWRVAGPARRHRAAPRRRHGWRRRCRSAPPALPAAASPAPDGARLARKPSPSVLYPRVRPSASTRTVLTEPVRSALTSRSSTRRNAASLCGRVTFQPRKPSRGSRPEGQPPRRPGTGQRHVGRRRCRGAGTNGRAGAATASGRSASPSRRRGVGGRAASSGLLSGRADDVDGTRPRSSRLPAARGSCDPGARSCPETGLRVSGRLTRVRRRR